MNCLLDTHALLWWLEEGTMLPARVRRIIADRANSLFVSAASFWEISIKHSKGKLELGHPLEQLESIAQKAEIKTLPINATHAIRAGTLPPHHRDPFDRVLVAQALSEDMIILSNDKMLHGYGARIRW